MALVNKIDIPKISKLYPEAHYANFFDSHQVNIPSPNHTALEIYLDMIAKTPRWVNRLMYMRNKVVSLLGLKNLGGLGDIDPEKPANTYRIGDRVGIFSILSLNNSEVIFGDSDKHLDVKLSICKVDMDRAVAISTVVHVHNILGKVYMFFITPIHKIIAPLMIKFVSKEHCGASQ